MREALKFLFAPEGALFREFLLDELVKGVDALSREQLKGVVVSLGLQNVMLPVLLPFASRPLLPLAPKISEEDKIVIANIRKVLDFLLGGDSERIFNATGPQFLQGLVPVLPGIAGEVAPEFVQKLTSRIAARLIRELYS